MLKTSDWKARSRLAAAAVALWASLCWLFTKVLDLLVFVGVVWAAVTGLRTLAGWAEYREYCSSEAVAIMLGAALIAFVIWRKTVTFQVGQIIGLHVGDKARVTTTREPWRKP